MSTATQHGLSCFTANLASYLLPVRPDALDVIARSVRLAVRFGGDRAGGDELAVSHHSVPLHRLAPGGELAYVGASTGSAALDGVAAELDRHGRVLVVTGRAALPWSVPEPGPGAPHLLLVDGRGDVGWHAVDDFSALLPAGQQEPFDGWITDEDLLKAMEPHPAPATEHTSRLAHAFGVPVALPPDGTYQWLELRPTETTGTDLAPGWVVGMEPVFAQLTEFWCGLGDDIDRRRFLEDMWACAQHHSYRYARLIAIEDADPVPFTPAIEAWENLPMALRFAADSAERGRPRPSMVRATFDQLRDTDRRARALLPVYGYPVVP